MRTACLHRRIFAVASSACVVSLNILRNIASGGKQPDQQLLRRHYTAAAPARFRLRVSALFIGGFGTAYAVQRAASAW